MIGAGLALALLWVSADPLTTRIAESAAAAQALQGRFDGAWILRDVGGVVLVFEMSDPPGSAGAVSGAWRDAAGRIGAAEFTRQGPGRLRVVVEGGSPARFSLTADVKGGWRGTLPGHGPVTLTRGLATPPPPV